MSDRESASTPPAKWLLPVAYVAFALGAVLAGIALLQLVTDAQLLDDPLTGMIGMWLLAFIVYGFARRTDRINPGT